MRDSLRRGVNKIWPGATVERQRFHRMAAAVDRVEHHVAALEKRVEELSTTVGTHDDRLDVLRHLVAKVEPYQPLYGVSGIIERVARPSADRARVIEDALGSVRGQRVLDIGSSLGYMSFFLAERGAQVTGWEYNPDNAEVARQVGAINGIRATFVTRELTTTTAETIEDGLYDAALVLAVFHHVIHFQGLEAAQQVVRTLVDKIPVLVLELAVKGEDPDLFWDAAQPEDPLTLLDLVRDDVTIERLGEFGTHLSGTSRSLYKVVRRQSVSVGEHTYGYDRVAYEAYNGSVVSSGPWRRRYYFGENQVIKEYAFTADAPDNWSQIIGELYVHSVIGSRTPLHHQVRLLDSELTDQRARLVFERVPGSLLSDLAPLPADQLVPLVADVLRTLRDLHAAGFHHNDVRSWNIQVHDGGAWLLDYGRASHAAHEDDVVALAWAVKAALTGGLEPLHEQKTALPPLTELDGTSLDALARALRSGERDVERLLDTLAVTVPGADAVQAQAAGTADVNG